ncbi:MAG: hypothetical protein IKF72_11165 [Kiritimatiellae bacterium]|nr:hypothetical protein [Kiritimatiellia bacterium]
MKKLMVVAILSSALVCAADSSYTYFAGDTGSGAVSITYDGDTTNIKTLTATTAGDTISITGDPITFADGATITLASSGTVSFAQKVTTLGATTLVRGDDAYKVWTGTAMTTDNPSTPAFPDIVTNDTISAADVADTWECIHVVGGAPASNSGAGKLSAGRYDRIKGSIGSGSFVTLNRTTTAFTYSIRVQLSPKANGTYVRCRTGVRSPRRGLYPDLEDRWPTADLWDQTSTTLWGAGLVARANRGIFGAGTSDATTYGGQWLNYTSAMGLNTIILKRKSAVGGPMKVRFDGGAELGGTTTIPFGMEAIVAVAGGDDASTFSNTITGTGDFTLVPSATPATSTAYMDGFISTSWQVFASNCVLSDMTPTEGYMLGGSQTDQVKCTVVGYSYDPVTDTATCQFHWKRGDTSAKYVAAKFRQNGLNVEVAGVGYGYTEVGTGGASAYPAFGTVLFPHKKIQTAEYEVKSWTASVSTLVDSSGEYVASNCTSGYGIRKITATFNGGSGVATISGDIKTLYGGKFTTAGANGAKMITSVTSADGLPAAGEAHVSDGTLRLAASGTPGGGTTKIVVHSGGDLRNATAWQLGNPSYQDVVLDGGTLFTDSESFYIFYATLSNAVLKGTWSPRVAYSSTYGYWHVIGTEPTTVLDGGYYWLNVYGANNAASARSGNYAFRIEVDDVTGDDEADFIVPALRGAAGRADNNYQWFWLEKYGPGTMKVKNNSTDLKMESKLYGGTLLLAGSNIMTNEVQFLGGGIAVDAGKSNSLGALTASKPGTITVGAGGSLSFASFVPDANLAAGAITIKAPMGGNVLRIGTNANGLDGKRGYFRWQDEADQNKLWRVYQDENGYIHPNNLGAIIIVQ